MSTSVTVTLKVNGIEYVEEVPVRILLSDFLRDRLGLTGVHAGCEHGVCGACTVSIDGQAVRSCITLAAQVDGSSVVTVEGINGESQISGQLHPLQDAFLNCRALQCGFCTPGYILTLEDALHLGDKLRSRDAVADNICRCTGYAPIHDAFETAEDAYNSHERQV